MPTLTITRGLPGSGKTTWAKDLVDQDPVRRARVNRDDLRNQLHGRRLGTTDQEKMVTIAQRSAIASLLHAGVNVICDDTNLSQRYARELRRVAQLAGADFEVHDMTDVPLEVCIERDRARPEKETVGEDVIRRMHRQYLDGKPYPMPFPAETDIHPAAADVIPYVPVAGTPPAVIVDIDGTVALMAGRSPYDETRVHEDRPNLPVIAAVRAMYAAGHNVVFCSGRKDTCRAATEAWIREHIRIPYAALYMRGADDNRKDSVVKAEIFDQHIRGWYTVAGVFDDRRQVVDMWRAHGLTVFQVADGNF